MQLSTEEAIIEAHRHGIISLAKATELLGVERDEFLHRAAEARIPVVPYDTN